MQVGVVNFSGGGFTTLLGIEIEFFGASNALNSIKIGSTLSTSIKLDGSIGLYLGPFFKHLGQIALRSHPLRVPVQVRQGVVFRLLAALVVDVEHLTMGTLLAFAVLD